MKQIYYNVKYKIHKKKIVNENTSKITYFLHIPYNICIPQNSFCAGYVLHSQFCGKFLVTFLKRLQIYTIAYPMQIHKPWIV